MTPTERLILENQIAIMRHLNEIGSANLRGPLAHRISTTQSFIYKLEADGGH